jgi:hypothetical protein
MIYRLKRILCNWLLGHVWRQGHDFVACERCRLVISKRELIRRRK